MIAPLRTVLQYVYYPDSDGKPMAENTLQLRWIFTLNGNIDAIFRDAPDVFVAGDNLVYPVQGDPTITQAPDVYVAFGRPKRDRGSYKVWDEGGVFPQVVWEVLSPSNTPAEMLAKREFYRRWGAEEYYQYDPETADVEGWTRRGKVRRFYEVPEMNGWVSPRLGVRFDTTGEELVLFRPDGSRFLTFDEIDQQAADARKQAATEKRRADTAKRRADAADRRAEEAEAKAAKLLAKLKAAGLDPNGD